MHMFSKKHRFLGGQGIVGAQAPVATGTAFASKYHDKNRRNPHLYGHYETHLNII